MRNLVKVLLCGLVVLSVCGCSSNEGNTESNDTFKVGMECNYPPFNWSDAQSNSTNVSEKSGAYCDGYDVQVAKRIAQGLNKELEVVKLDWDALQPALSSGTIDAIIAGMTDTPKRRENADFTTPYYQSEMVMIVRADSELVNATSIQDFSGYKVLGQLNTMYDDVIDQIDGVVHLQPLESYPYMIAALLNGGADALTAETPVGEGAVMANPSLALVKFAPGKGFEIDESETSVSIAIKKGNTELLNDVQAILDGITSSERDQMMLEATQRQPVTE